RSGADAFAGRQERPRQRAGVDAGTDGTPEPEAYVAKVAGLAAVDIFSDTAGEHDAVDAAEIEDRIGEAQMLDRLRHRPLRPSGSMRPWASTTCSRPPMWTAAVAITWPPSTTPSLVVPPPISILRMRLPSSCETREAPEP